MKVEGENKVFKPITITLESKSELMALLSVMRFRVERMESCPREIKRHYIYLDTLHQLVVRLEDFV